MVYNRMKWKQRIFNPDSTLSGQVDYKEKGERNSFLKINIAKLIPFHEEEITTNKGKTKCNSINSNSSNSLLV